MKNNICYAINDSNRSHCAVSIASLFYNSNKKDEVKDIIGISCKKRFGADEKTDFINSAVMFLVNDLIKDVLCTAEALRRI